MITPSPRPLCRTAVPGVLAAALALAVPLRSQVLPQDQGASGAWQKIQKLRTTASVLHTTAHPDDEHGGMLGADPLGRR